MRDVFWPLAGTLLMQTVSTMLFLSVPVIAPVLAAEAGFAASSIGIYTSLVFAGAMPVSLVIGGLIGRFGAIRVMQIGLFAACIALLGPLLGTLWAVFASAVVVGMGYGPNTPGASHVLARFTRPQDRPLVFSIKQSGAPLGGVFAGLLMPWIVELADWQTALMVASAIGAVTVLAVQPLRPRADDDRSPNKRISVRSSVAQLRLLAANSEMQRMTFASFTYAGIQMCLFSFMVTYLVERHSFSLVLAGMAFSAMQVAGVVARIGWGWVADRIVPARLVLGGLGLASAGFVVLIAWFSADWPFWAIAGVCALAGATASGWNGVFLAEIARVAPSGQISAATGGTIFFTYFGLVVGPSIFAGVVAVTDSYAVAFYAIAAAIAFAGLLVLRTKGATPATVAG
jgi:MFS family permease